MAVKRQAVKNVIGLQDALLVQPPNPIVANRAPTTSDLAQLGTLWVDTTADAIYGLTSITANSANWTTSPASGSGSFTAVTVNPGDVTVTAGDVVITAGNLDINTGNATIAGDLTVGGTTTLNGDIDLTSAALIDLTSTLDAAPSIYLHANGGTSESIEIRSDQGTGNQSVYIRSDVGSVTVASGRNAANALIFEATAGGIDILASSAAAGEDIDIVATGSSVNINSTENAADSVTITSTNGGIDIFALGAAAGEDIDIVATGSSVNISATEAAGDAITLSAGVGGIDINSILDIDVTSTGAAINLVSTQAADDAIVLHASNAAGGIQLRAGSNGIDIGPEADTTPILIGSVAPSVDRTITLGGGTIIGDDIDDVINVGVGGMTADGDEQITRTLNIGTGTTSAINNALATADMVVNIASGDVTDDGTGTATLTVNVATGTNTSASQVVNVGSSGATINIDGATLISDSINANTSINTGTSTGTVTIGNGSSGAIAIVGGSTVDLDAVGALSLNSSAAAINIGNDDIDQAINVGTDGERTITIGNTTGATSVVIQNPANVGLTLQNSVRVITGAGSPNGAVTAPAGSIWLRTDPAGATSRMYINTDSGTTWTNITCAA